MSEGQGQGAQGTPTAGQGEGNQGGTNQGGLSQEFGNPFLSEVSPEHKAIVEPYLRKWDGNITQKFQELHAKYQPYEQLGDLEQLNQAVFISQLLESDPQQVFNFLAQELGVQVGNAQGPGQQQNEPEVPEEFEGLPPAVAQQLQQQQQALEAIAQMLLDNQKTSQQQAEDQQLEELMSTLQEKYKDQGEFDEEYVLSKMMRGVDPDKAVQSFYQLVQGSINQRGQQQPAFPILGGGGVTPQNGSRQVTDLSRGETKDLVTQILAARQQQSS